MKSVVKIGIPDYLYEDLISHPDVGAEKLVPYPLWKYPPEWYTNSSKEMRDLSEFFTKGDSRRASYIQCPSVSNIIKKSIVVPAYQDYHIACDGHRITSAVDESGNSMMTFSHSKNQHEALTGGNYENVKIQSAMFLMSMGEEQLVLNLPPELHESYYKSKMWTNFGMFPYKRKMSMQTNLFMPVDKEYELTIPAGTVLNYFTFPNLKSKIHVEYVRVKNNFNPLSMLTRRVPRFILK